MYQRDEVEAHCKMQLAGPIAQAITADAHYRSTSSEDWERHRRESAELLMRLDGVDESDARGPYLSLLTSRTRRLVQDHWGAIVHVAEALKRDPAMNGDEFRALMVEYDARPLERVA